jgi:hypothetical protein
MGAAAAKKKNGRRKAPAKFSYRIFCRSFSGKFCPVLSALPAEQSAFLNKSGYDEFRRY